MRTTTPRITRRPRRSIPALLVAIALVAAACGASDAGDESSETWTPLDNGSRAEPATTAAERSIDGGESQQAATTMAATADPAAGDSATGALQAHVGEPESAHDDVYARGYGTNPFVDTVHDELSTFALDVDTGSYTLARSYVQSGQLPYADLIRVEEMVNYFEQGYDAPTTGTFAVYADGAPTPFTTSSRNHMIRIGIKAEEIAAEARPDANLTFVVDVSGSMREGDRLEIVKDALSTMVEELNVTDSVAIVAYDTEAHLLLDHTSVRHIGTILDAIGMLTPGGSTNAEAGLTLGYDLASAAYEPGTINRVILASDGVANVGTTSAGGILSRIEEQASVGINLTAVGVGLGNYNDALLEQLADRGDGFYAYVDSLDEAERLFVQGLTGTLLTVAEEAKVQVEFNPATVESYRLVGFENRAIADEHFRDDSVDAGEIGAGHDVTALYEVRLSRPLAELGDAELATVNLRWRNPNSTVFTEFNGRLPASVLTPDFEAAAERFQLDVVVAAYAEILRDSPWAQELSFGWVAAEADRLARALDDGDVWEFAELSAMAAELAGEPVPMLSRP